MTTRRTTASIALSVLGIVVLGLVAYWLSSRHRLDSNSLTVAIGLVGALAGLAAAVATAYAAVAALRAARESSEAAARSTEALGLALEPSVVVQIEGPSVKGRELTGPGTTVVKLYAVSRWPASDIVVRVEAADGRKAEYTLAYLGPEPAVHSFPFEDARGIPSDDPDWRGRVNLTDKVVVDYSDERKLLRWRLAFQSTLTLDYASRFHTSSSSSSNRVTRLS